MSAPDAPDEFADLRAVDARLREELAEVRTRLGELRQRQIAAKSSEILARMEAKNIDAQITQQPDAGAQFDTARRAADAADRGKGYAQEAAQIQANIEQAEGQERHLVLMVGEDPR